MTESKDQRAFNIEVLRLTFAIDDVINDMTGVEDIAITALMRCILGRSQSNYNEERIQLLINRFTEILLMGDD
jgi:hypothetical protein